jgi:hypothetical protein
MDEHKLTHSQPQTFFQLNAGLDNANWRDLKVYHNWKLDVNTIWPDRIVVFQRNYRDL